MISKETAIALYNCHQLITNAKELLKVTKEAIDKNESGWADSKGLIDAFGRRQRTLELGIPSGDNGHRLINVDPELGVIIIEAQIKSYESKLEALNELAKQESNNIK